MNTLTHLCEGSWLGVQFHSDIMTTPKYEKCEDVSGTIFSICETNLSGKHGILDCPRSACVAIDHYNI